MTAVTELRLGPGLWRAPSWLLLAWGVRGAVGSKDGGQLREGQGLSASGLAFCSVGPGRNAGRLGKRPLYLRPGSCAHTPGALPRRGLRARAPWPGTDGAAHARPRAAASLRPPVSEHVCARPPHGSTGVPGHEGPSDGKVGLARWPRGRQAVGRGGLQCRGPGGQRWCGTAAESGGAVPGPWPEPHGCSPEPPRGGAVAPAPLCRQSFQVPCGPGCLTPPRAEAVTWGHRGLLLARAARDSDSGVEAGVQRGRAGLGHTAPSSPLGR